MVMRNTDLILDLPNNESKERRRFVREFFEGLRRANRRLYESLG